MVVLISRIRKMMCQRHHQWIILLSLLGLSYLTQPADCVIVDGSKKKDISATKKQGNEVAKIDPFNTKTCGLSDQNMDEHEFINMAREGQFPWIVSFQIKVPKNSTLNLKEMVASKSITETKAASGHQMEDVHFCCGSFISDKWILSAAHCFAPRTIKQYLENDKLKVVAGSHRVSSRTPVNRNLTIERIYYHANFDNNMPVGFDVALVELSERVEFSQKRNKNNFGEQKSPFINAICLPKNGNKYNFNETARVAGWGLSNAGDPNSTPSKLLTTDILLNSAKDCAESYSKQLRTDKPKVQSQKYDDFLCAGYKSSRDACQSDSGGPLMQYADGKAVVIGIVSYGIGCATKGVPGLYTRTSAYINWIRDITTNGKDSSVSFKLIESKGKPGKVEQETTFAPEEKSAVTDGPKKATSAGHHEKQRQRQRRPGKGSGKQAEEATTRTTTTEQPKKVKVHKTPTPIEEPNIIDFKFFDDE